MWVYKHGKKNPKRLKYCRGQVPYDRDPTHVDGVDLVYECLMAFYNVGLFLINLMTFYYLCCILQKGEWYLIASNWPTVPRNTTH